MKLLFNKRSGAVVMSPDSEGLDGAVEGGVSSNYTQPSRISCVFVYSYESPRPEDLNGYSYDFLVQQILNEMTIETKRKLKC